MALRKVEIRSLSGRKKIRPRKWKKEEENSRKEWKHWGFWQPELAKGGAARYRRSPFPLFPARSIAPPCPQPERSPGDAMRPQNGREASGLQWSDNQDSPRWSDSPRQAREPAAYKAELERLLRAYEPANVDSATHLLETYAGMVRLQPRERCYRHYYAGKGSFRVALDDNQEAGSPRVSSPGPLQLPTSAIGTYLQAKLQSRRGGAARNAKLEDVRGATAAGGGGAASRHPGAAAAVVPRRRAVSFTASLQHSASDLNSRRSSSSNRDDGDDEASLIARRASTPSYSDS
ncbi:hypothetical protein BBJ28_00015038 [Nothophytophthora sp. Chile5]|nr:hypothetical protein BBJ28_00015038 [Nothophytophthora sp. Chile5]